MNVVVPTVPHTGTMFTVRTFIDAGFEHQPLDGRGDNLVLSGHLVNMGIVSQAMAALDKHPGVVPIRHPYVVAESWRRKGKALDNMVVAWLNLVDYIDPFKPFYLPLDVPFRQSYFDAIRVGLGVPIKTKWAVVRNPNEEATGTDGLDWAGLRPDQIVIDLAREIKPFLDRFYGSSPDA